MPPLYYSTPYTGYRQVIHTPRFQPKRGKFRNPRIEIPNNLLRNSPKHRSHKVQTKHKLLKAQKNRDPFFVCVSLFCVLCFVWVFVYCVLCLRRHFVLRASNFAGYIYRSPTAHAISRGNSIVCPRLAVSVGGKPILSRTVLCG